MGWCGSFGCWIGLVRVGVDGCGLMHDWLVMVWVWVGVAGCVWLKVGSDLVRMGSGMVSVGLCRVGVGAG